MKKTLFILLLVTIIIACNSNSSTPDSSKEESNRTTSPDTEKGLGLVAKSDCFTCHKVAEPSIGPAYEAIATKYPDNEDTIIMLTQKIIKGGAGNWGPVPMPPHNELSPDDARLMVKYILSLK